MLYKTINTKNFISIKHLLVLNLKNFCSLALFSAKISWKCSGLRLYNSIELNLQFILCNYLNFHNYSKLLRDFVSAIFKYLSQKKFDESVCKKLFKPLKAHYFNSNPKSTVTPIELVYHIIDLYIFELIKIDSEVILI